MKSFDDWWNEDTLPENRMIKVAYEAGQQSRQAEIDELKKRIDLISKSIIGLRNEFNLWADDGEGFDAIEAQIDILENELKGKSE